MLGERLLVELDGGRKVALALVRATNASIGLSDQLEIGTNLRNSRSDLRHLLDNLQGHTSRPSSMAFSHVLMVSSKSPFSKYAAARLVRNVMSFGQISQAFWKCVIAPSKLRVLYASAPSFFSSSACFLVAASSSSSISTSSSFAGSGAFDEEAAGCGGGEVGGLWAPGRDTPGGSSSEPSSREKPCMSMPISAPRTSIMRGSDCRAVSASFGFCWNSCSFWTNAGSARCFAVRGLAASLPRS
ncbi:hypothetical protein BD310DRAFT_218469 [Dichomitus squalens]|uniref:Uncharacterized protein n=1 Tax=Dichomitus squalens TaxID=114155 RepID=A0A4Q9Q354_9APHY|nr:hypothetical protein BD310DRAFT_218469 [Dichomitus squalens]